MIHSPLGLIHTLAASSALIVGAIVFFRPKAGILHRRLGYAYTLAMIITIFTAFMIYRLTGKANILHLAALVSGLTLGNGLWHVFQRRNDGKWFEKHFKAMSSSYLGLLAAFFAETATRIGMPYLQEKGMASFGWFWSIIGIVSFLIIFVGMKVLKAKQPRLEKYRPKATSNNQEETV